MKVLVIGDGLLGSEIVKQTDWDYISRKKDGIEITQPSTYQKYLIGYDVVVNCIAYTQTYSDERDLHWNINYQAVDDLIEFCNEHNIKLVHISTDYVYANSYPNATENDVPVHLNSWYGYTKLLADGLVQLRSKKYLLCRLSHKPKPFPYDKAWSDVYTNCDYVDVIAGLVIDLIEDEFTGVYNVGTETKSIYNLATETKDVDPIKAPLYVPHDVTMSLDKLYLWRGWIEEINDDEIYCILRKDYHLDKELRFPKKLLTPEQLELLTIGIILQINIGTGKIQFMTKHGGFI